MTITIAGLAKLAALEKAASFAPWVEDDGNTLPALLEPR